MRKIKVLVVEDSPLIANIISDILESDSGIRVVGKAYNGSQGIEMALQKRPDVITMDIHMPVMDGLEATKMIMAKCPTPILILSTTAKNIHSKKVFQAMSYGALEVCDKTAFDSGTVSEKAKQNLITHIKVLSNAQVITHPLGKIESRAKTIQKKEKTLLPIQNVVGIVSSTGGPEALKTVFSMLPKDFGFPILSVQHITDGFLQGFVEWLRETTGHYIKTARNGEKILSGRIYVAPTGLQMRVTQRGTLSLKDDPPYEGHRPSGTILLKSIAQAFGEDALGIILTGMGHDGAEGLKHIYDRGGRTLAQDEKTSAIYGMPAEAKKLGVVDHVLPLEDMVFHILKWAKKMKRAA